jgi:predicted regulator of Ras-like GTPase activity (Roadblock/LC7/MglB family)
MERPGANNMGFAEHLKAVVSSVDGAIACAVMGFDGITVETHQAPAAQAASDQLEIGNAWVEFANLLSQLRNVAGTLKTGAVTELSVNSEKCLTLMRMVTPEYFLVLGLLPTGNYGKGRYVLRVTAPLVAKEL